MSGQAVYTYVGNDPLDRTDPSGNTDSDCQLPCKPQGNPQVTRQGGVETAHAEASQNLMKEVQQEAVDRGATVDSAAYNQQARTATDGAVDSKKQPDITVNTTERDGARQTTFGEVERNPAKNAATQAKLEKLATQASDGRKIKTILKNFAKTGKLIPGIASLVSAGAVVSSVASGDAEAATRDIVDTLPGGAMANMLGDVLPTPNTAPARAIFVSPF